jgi:hypothetical protein
MEVMRNDYKILVEKAEGKIPHWKPWHRWAYNIKAVLEEIVYEDVYWVYLAQDRYRWQAFVDTIMNLRFQKR